MRHHITKNEVRRTIHNVEVIDTHEIKTNYPQLTGVNIQRLLDRHENDLTIYVVSNKFYYVKMQFDALVATLKK